MSDPEPTNFASVLGPFEAIILDTETTTNKETPERPLEVVELAWFPLGKTAATSGFRSLYKPSMPCTFGATAVHHLLPEDLLDKRPSAQAPKDLPGAQYWIGHNIDFDWKALGSPPVKRICTLAMSRALWPEMDSHTLTAMMYFIKGATPSTREELRSAHSAEADIDFCETLLQTIMAVTKTRELEALWELSEESRIPKTMTFGKFAGQPVSKVDRGYASWYNKQPDADPYLLAAFRQHGLLR